MKTILVIDDDDDQREIISELLKSKYELKTACGKEDGYNVLAKSQPDLIILDVMMETISSGFEMCRELKADDRYKEIKVLMLTNVDNEMNLNFQEESGDSDWLPADDYLVKPVDPDALRTKVAEMIG